jgi:hypothetical protein
MDTTDYTGPPHPAANPGSLVLPPLVGRGPERVRLRQLDELAARHLGETAPTTFGAISRVSSRYSRVAVYWRRRPSRIEQAAVNLAYNQTYMALADYFVGLRSAGGGA